MVLPIASIRCEPFSLTGRFHNHRIVQFILIASSCGLGEVVAQRALQLGTTGIWTNQLDSLPGARAQEIAAEIEARGFGALWFGEAFGRDALTLAGLLLAGTRRIVIATGIANIYGRDPVTMAAAQKTLAVRRWQ